MSKRAQTKSKAERGADYWIFMGEEKKSHQQSLSEMYKRTEVVLNSSRSKRARDLRLAGFDKWVLPDCKNLVLFDEGSGGWCEYCSRFHYQYDRKGNRKSSGKDPMKNKDSSYDREAEHVNSGKYRGEWTPTDWDLTSPLRIIKRTHHTGTELKTMKISDKAYDGSEHQHGIRAESTITYRNIEMVEDIFIEEDDEPEISETRKRLMEKYPELYSND